MWASAQKKAIYRRWTTSTMRACARDDPSHDAAWAAARRPAVWASMSGFTGAGLGSHYGCACALKPGRYASSWDGSCRTVCAARAFLKRPAASCRVRTATAAMPFAMCKWLSGGEKNCRMSILSFDFDELSRKGGVCHGGPRSLPSDAVERRLLAAANGDARRCCISICGGPPAGKNARGRCA